MSALIVTLRTSEKFGMSAAVLAVVHEELQPCITGGATLGLQDMLVSRLVVGVDPDLSYVAGLFVVGPSKATICQLDKGIVTLHVFLCHSVIVEVKDNNFDMPEVIGVNTLNNASTHYDDYPVLVFVHVGPFQKKREKGGGDKGISPPKNRPSAKTIKQGEGHSLPWL